MLNINPAEDINQAAETISRLGVIVYPTETLLALGGLGCRQEVVQRVAKIKKRPAGKPLPLVAGSLEQCLEYVELDRDGLKIAETFWPGSLSILAGAKEQIPLGIKDDQGMVSIRVTPHARAAELCLLCSSPLVATSANISGRPACREVQMLDPELVSCVDGIYQFGSLPDGGLPSTLIRITGPQTIQVLRPGRITLDELIEHGLQVDNS